MNDKPRQFVEFKDRKVWPEFQDADPLTALEMLYLNLTETEHEIYDVHESQRPNRDTPSKAEVIEMMSDQAFVQSRLREMNKGEESAWSQDELAGYARGYLYAEHVKEGNEASRLRACRAMIAQIILKMRGSE